MRAKRVCKDEQFRLIMECRRSGLSDYQWCEANGVLPGTFYTWVSRLKKAGYSIPGNAVKETTAPVIQEVVAIPVVGKKIPKDDMSVRQNTNNPVGTSPAAVEILSGGTTVRIYNGADTKTIQDVLQLMGGVDHAW